MENFTKEGTELTAQGRILIATDDESLSRAIRERLEAEGCEVTVAGPKADIRQLAIDRHVVLLDDALVANGKSGPELCRALDGDSALEDVALLLMISGGDSEARAAGLDSGADDVLEKPFTSAELLARIRAALKAQSRLVILKRETDRLKSLTTLDALTGVLNRRGIESRLDEEYERARRYGQPLSLLFVDLDDFKRINDTHGHAVGDEALREVAALFSRVVRVTDTLGRFGGDEFVVLLPSSDERACATLVSRLEDEILQVRIGTPEGDIPLGLSIGRATYDPGNHGSAADLLASADQSMYRIKSERRSRSAEIPRRRGKILIIEGDAELAPRIRGRIEKLGCEVILARDGEAAEGLARQVDSIVIGTRPGAGDGFDLCRRLKEAWETRHTPILVLSSLPEPEAKVASFRAGADEYLAVPLDEDELATRIESALGTRQRLIALEDESVDLARLAATDPVTGVLNRRGLDQLLAEEFTLAATAARPLAVVLVEVTNLREFRAASGQTCVDDILHRTARILEDEHELAGFIGRFGGGFLGILPGVGPEEAARVADGIARDLAGRIRMESGVGVLVASFAVGSAVAGIGAIDHPDDLVQAAQEDLLRSARPGPG